MEEYIKYLSGLIHERDSLKLVKKEAKKFQSSHSAEECYQTGLKLYQLDNFQIQEVGVFLMGYAAHQKPEALDFLRNTVSTHESWKVQETLAMAFDIHCKQIGYEVSLPLIWEWLEDERANVRRAVSEGLRVWISRPYFKDHPKIAIEFLAAHKDDASEYVRKSIGNALKDISKKYPDLVQKELETWDTSFRPVLQVFKLARKWLDKNPLSGGAK